MPWPPFSVQHSFFTKGVIMPYKNIVVAMDFSGNAHLALDYAIYIGKTFQSHITLLHGVVDYSGVNIDAATQSEHRKYLEIESRNAIEKLKVLSERVTRAGLESDIQLEEDILPADAILNHLARKKYDLIVMGTHGMTGFKKWLYGSVAEKVLRYAPIPVCTVHHNARQAGINKILFPVDFSDHSKIAIQQAPELAAAFDSQITFLNVIETQMHPAYYAGGVQSIMETDPGIQQRVSSLLKEFCGQTVPNARYEVREGLAHKVITEYAAGHEIDLIVMGTHGYNFLDHILLGSTTERVVSHAPCAVLTIGHGTQNPK